MHYLTVATGARQIKSLKVECKNSSKCSWTGELRELDSHLQSCEHEFVTCKYAAVGCQKKCLRKALEKHEQDSRLHLGVTTKCVLRQQNEIAQLKKELSVLRTMLNKATPFTIKLPNFSKKKSDNEALFSSPFYTSVIGYKMCLKMVANGWYDGKGTHISVYAHLMKGDNDDYLTWPFIGTVTFELRNQLEDKNHHKKTTAFPADDVASQRVVTGETLINGWGYHTFISHADLNQPVASNCRYLVNDSLTFRVTVQVPAVDAPTNQH